MPCKQKALYVKCCIIPNGVTDTQGDTLYAEDIKKIFTSFNNQDNFEIYHNNIPIEDVSLLENYISTADETIGTAVVPSGSWNAVIRVDNPRIGDGLLTGEFGGVSLNNRIAPRCSEGLSGQVRYQDVLDKECVIPLLISFVERGANGYGLHVMDYPAYIQKSAIKTGVKKMAFNLLDGLKSLIKEAEASENEEPAIMKEDTEAQEEEEVAPATEEALSEEPVIEKADETEEEEPAEDDEAQDNEEPTDEEEEATIKKADNDLEARVAALEEAVAKLTAETPEDEAEEETDEAEDTDEDTPKITKSEKVIVSTENVPKQTNYYEMTGRDPITGVKIRDQANILK